MKIGAGGLQGIIAQDAFRGYDAGKVKTAAEQAIVQSEDPALRKQLYDLNKTVERMRKAAEAYNQPLDFEVKKGEKPGIKARDRRTGAGREFTLEEAEDWVEEMGEKGRKTLNEYF